MKFKGTADWTLKPGYPQIGGTPDSETLTVVYTVRADQLNELPDAGSVFDASGFPGVFSRPDLKLGRRQVKPLAGYAFYEVQIEYMTPEQSESDETIWEEVERVGQEIEEPLASVPGYLYNWDHCLCAMIGVTELPYWWASAVSPVMDEGQYEFYVWIRADEQVPDGYYMMKYKTMIAEARQASAITVRVTQRCRRLSRLNKSARADNTIQTPPETFDLNGEWLRGVSSIVKEGKLWKLSVEYKHAASIDRRLYVNS